MDKQRLSDYEIIAGNIITVATIFHYWSSFAGIICLILQVTLIGWIPAAIWSVYALSQYKTDEKIRRALGR